MDSLTRFAYQTTNTGWKTGKRTQEHRIIEPQY